MSQALKDKYPDCLLLIGNGEDYTAFPGNDAEKCIAVIGTDTFSRAQLDINLQKLVKAGNRVAVADILEKPKYKLADVMVAAKANYENTVEPV